VCSCVEKLIKIQPSAAALLTSSIEYALLYSHCVTWRAVQQPAKNKVLARSPSAMCFFIVKFLTLTSAYGFGLTTKAEPRRQICQPRRRTHRVNRRRLRRIVRQQFHDTCQPISLDRVSNSSKVRMADISVRSKLTANFCSNI
jgi:hypothetical protein